MTDLDLSAQLIRRAADSEPNSLERRLLVAAAFAEASLIDGVLVGGAAVDHHTGTYRPTDIDLVGADSPGGRKRLAELGFERQGRHHVLSFPDSERLAVEVPAPELFDLAEEEPTRIDLQPGEVKVIALNDLMMDRLLQVTDRTEVTYQEALRLAVAAYEDIDWVTMEHRAKANAGPVGTATGEIPPLLARVRREARRILREA